MTCSDFDLLLDDLLSGDLSPPLAAQAERHRALCPDCQKYHAQYQLTISLARSAHAGAAAPPQDFSARILSRLRHL